MSEYIVDTFGIVQDFADLHGDMSTPLYQAIMDVMVSRQREEIVRCRDCRHFDAAGPWCCEPSKVFIDEYGIEICAHIKPDGFCAWGERRENA